jgi:DNA-binding transcriptional LysR family regulator
LDRLNAMSVLVAVTESGGFSAAGRRLRLPLATVSRRIAELEAHLNAQLLTRTTWQVTLTDSGRA